jgi:hypothetical protein
MILLAVGETESVGEEQLREFMITEKISEKFY